MSVKQKKAGMKLKLKENIQQNTNIMKNTIRNNIIT